MSTIRLQLECEYGTPPYFSPRSFDRAVPRQILMSPSSAQPASDFVRPGLGSDDSPPQSPSAGQFAYDDLLRAYHSLREENRRRTVALASAAHELKTPLSIMAGYLELLLSNKLGSLNSRQSKVLSAMQASSSRLQQFIQDFLTYSALETGALSIQPAKGHLNQCLSELYEIWLVRFQAKGVALYYPQNEAIPEFCFDSPKVQRVVSNLLDNAYLSTPSGGSVWLTAELYSWERRTHTAANIAKEQRARASGQPNSVRVSVSDTGPGIAPEFQQEIFDDFVSLRKPSGNNSGTGLGLAIARRLISAQQGKIWVESETGSGCRFCFLLPLAPCIPSGEM